MAQKNVRLVRTGQLVTDGIHDKQVVRSVDIVINLANGVALVYEPLDTIEVEDVSPDDPEVVDEIERDSSDS
jgi:hypothetical protein